MLCRVFVSFSCYIVELIFLFGHKLELLQMFLSKIIHEGINYSTVCTKVMISLTTYLFITSFYPSFMKMEVYKSNSLQCETIYIKSNNIILYSMISGHHFLFFFKKWIEGTLYIILYYTMNTIIQSCFSFLNRFTF